MKRLQDITDEQIAAAQLRVVLDGKLGRHTPDSVRRLAAQAFTSDAGQGSGTAEPGRAAEGIVASLNTGGRTYQRLFQGAEAGDVEAMLNLASLLEEQGDDKAASDWVHRAAETDHPEAMTRFGLYLLCRTKPTEALEWLRRAALTGHPEGVLNFAHLLQDLGNKKEAEEWLRRAIDTDTDAPSSESMYRLAYLLLEKGSEEAEEWLHRAAELGHGKAMGGLARLRQAEGNLEEAEEWLRQADSTLPGPRTRYDLNRLPWSRLSESTAPPDAGDPRDG